MSVDITSTRLRALETAEPPVVYDASDQNVGSPPSQADANAAFGATAAQLRDGWSGIIDDNGAATIVWLAVSKNDLWWFVNLSASGVGAHNLLNGGVHPDTVNSAPVADAMIYADATPQWDRTTHIQWSETNDVLTLTPQAAGGITFAGATTFNRIRVPDNLASAMYLDDAGGIEYLKIVSTNAGPAIIFDSAGNACDVYSPGTGVNSTKFGLNATSGGAQGTAFGDTARANGAASIAIGQNALAAGTNNISIGRNSSTSTAATGGALAIGSASVAAEGGIAIGVSSRANATYSLAIGTSIQSTANDSIAIGSRNTVVSGTTSIAMGYNVDISGNYSAAFGRDITVAQSNAFVIGDVYSSSYYVDIGSGTLAPSAKLHLIKQSADTAAIRDIIIIDHESSGVPANSFGAGIQYRLESSTTASQDAARISALWTVATHATRSAALTFDVVSNTSELEFLRLAGDNNYIEFFPAGGGDVKTEYNSITNTILGVGSGRNIGAGTNNTLIGSSAGNAITSGQQNIAIGTNTMLLNSTGTSNIAIGFNALDAAANPFTCIAIGSGALGTYNAASNPTGLIGIGNSALNALTTGLYNTVIGYTGFTTVTTGQQNTGIGYEVARIATTTASYNTAIGYRSLRGMTAANYNTAIGRSSGGDTIGVGSLTTGQYNTFIGADTRFTTNTQRDYSTVVGYGATVDTSNACIFGGVSTGSAWVDVGIGIDAPAAHVHQVKRTALTNTSQDMLRIDHNTSGTAANSFGSDIEWYLESSTTATQNAAQLRVSWENATHANRSARAIYSVVSNASLVEFMRLVGSDTQATTIFNTDNNDIDFQIDGDTTNGALFLDASREVWGMFRTASIAARLHINQYEAAYAAPVLWLEQIDVDEPFISFEGTAAAADLTRSIVDEGDVTTATRIGWVKIQIDDDGNQVTDGDYYVPFYTLA